ncbi:hypothetical protein HXX76_003869 [Chlamydomonas incerta]|uniref:Uncharacterized protein n=1 Tax=Chlamydomonas incerta TaxID=51695 RepID=A0A835TBI7_CHLIN|nr:hypothetical protein HXX76_003869 [Chlamydomonas incerta]|eukprot:KAG2441016.1 hypothetical protein HXX76_003869 [Chlamydomonas incerta]
MAPGLTLAARQQQRLWQVLRTELGAPRRPRPKVPLRLYRQGLPHRELGPPQSVWEADKNTAVLALADRVHQLEDQLQQAHATGAAAAAAAAAGGAGGAAAAAAAYGGVLPPPTVDLLPVPRTVLGATSHANVAAYDGIHAGGAAPVPVKYYPPPPPGQQLTPEQQLLRLQVAEGARGHARAFAASVTESAAATVPSVMMRRKRNEAATQAAQATQQQQQLGPELDAVHGDENQAGPGSGPGRGGGGGGGVAGAVGVSKPLGYASNAASAAASVHVIGLKEPGGPLQPAGPYPMVAAALAVGTPGTGGSTWEQSKIRALMSLEQQLNMLKAQVESYKDQESRHRRQMIELNDKHREEMIEAAGAAGRRLKRLMKSAGPAFARRLLVLRLTRALHAWRRVAVRNRRLRWAAAVWRRRSLEEFLTAWHMVTMQNKHQRYTRRRAAHRYLRTLLLAWHTAAAARRQMRRLERRVLLLRCRWLLAAWAQRSGQLREKRMRVRGAEAVRSGRLLRNGWQGLVAEVARVRRTEAELRQRLDKAMLVKALQVSKVTSWLAYTHRSGMLGRKLRALKDVWRRRRRALVLAAWAAAAARLATLKATDELLRSIVREQQLRTVLSCLRLATRERAWSRRRAGLALRAWRAAAGRLARNMRLVVLRRLERNRQSLAAIFDCWRVLAKARMVQLHLREIHRLQELEPMYEHQMELVRQDRAAVQASMRALMAEANLLRSELLRGFVMSAEGGLLGRPIRWKSMPADPGQWLPPPRCRHSTLCLRALQLPNARPPGAAAQPLPMHSTLRASLTASAVGLGGQHGGVHMRTTRFPAGGTTLGVHGHHGDEVEAVVPDVAGVLVVFGGVGEEEWFRDLQVLEVTYSEGGARTFHWHQVEVESEAAPAGGVEAGTLRAAWPDEPGVGGDAGPKLPLPTRRDHAACVTSPNQFVIVGGFDGKTELMDIHAVTVRAAEDSVGWAAHVRLVASRNRTPAGRSHHTVTPHAAGRSLYVFGGYSSSRGVTGELWTFHMDHHEWWQPNTTGDQPPPRRNHVAALVGGRLYIHGGFNGTECLDDAWVLDPQTWHWERLRTTGPAPSRRRGHAAEVVDDRYLLVHGGYDGGGGGAGYLGDAAVLDTTTGAWTALNAEGGPEDMPTARSFHTLTLVGHVLVALGGSGPLGPLLDVHLLESPPLVAGLAQQYKLMATAAQLSATQAGLADTEAALAVTRHRAELAEQQLQTLRERSAELVERHNAALQDLDRVKQRLAGETARVVAAEVAASDARLALATVERRLRRTREGGHEVAEAARDMHDTVCDLREEVARMRSQLLGTSQQQARESAALASASAERQLLAQQLAGAQQEAALLRGMLATAEAEFRAALDRQRAQMEAELVTAAEHAKQLARAAAGAAGGMAMGGGADMDLVLLNQLATATARAETAEMRLHAMEREHGQLQADVGSIKRQLAQQRHARDAAEERAAAAVAHMHASELRYQQQLEDTQLELARLQRARWREDLGLGPGPTSKKRAAPAAPEVPAQPEAATQQEEEEDVEAREREEAERLLREARPPPEGPLEDPARRVELRAKAAAVGDPEDPAAHFTVQHVEAVVVDEPTELEVLPEVARLLQLQRRLMGDGV